MEESLKKYITKTHFYHLVNGTEDGLIFDKLFLFYCYSVNFFERALKRGLCSKKQTYEGLIDEILYKTMFFSSCNRDRGWFCISHKKKSVT